MYNKLQAFIKKHEDWKEQRLEYFIWSEEGEKICDNLCIQLYLKSLMRESIKLFWWSLTKKELINSFYGKIKSKDIFYIRDITYKLGGTDHEDSLDYLRSHGVSEANFRADVLKVYNGSTVTVDTKPQKINEIPGTVESNGIAYIEGYNVNLRSGSSTENSIIRKLQKGEAYKVCIK